ncbi:MAG TPA: hypothetical protein VHZ25_14065 [Acidobacteriaceae bacterium]|jgi:hypothetical protein|nr:hypothetical protein [Acidobacteriaceae bacterium]
MLPIAKFVALTLSILSLGATMQHAFFVPGSPWADRLIDGLAMLGLAASICFASGFLFEIPNRKFDPEPTPHLIQTLPVRLFFWSVGLMALMFLLSWFLAEYFVPMIWKNQPY